MSFWQPSCLHLLCPHGAHWTVDTCVIKHLFYVGPAYLKSGFTPAQQVFYPLSQLPELEHSNLECFILFLVYQEAEQLLEFIKGLACVYEHKGRTSFFMLCFALKFSLGGGDGSLAKLVYCFCKGPQFSS